MNKLIISYIMILYTRSLQNTPKDSPRFVRTMMILYLLIISLLVPFNEISLQLIFYKPRKFFFSKVCITLSNENESISFTFMYAITTKHRTSFTNWVLTNAIIRITADDPKKYCYSHSNCLVHIFLPESTWYRSCCLCYMLH